MYVYIYIYIYIYSVLLALLVYDTITSNLIPTNQTRGIKWLYRYLYFCDTNHVFIAEFKWSWYKTGNKLHQGRRGCKF